MELTIRNRTQTEIESQLLLNTIEEKDAMVDKLQNKISELTEQNKKYKDDITILEKSLGQKKDIQLGIELFSDTILQLEHQIQEIVKQSVEYEEKLDAKLTIINAMEEELDLLAIKIEDIKSVLS